MFPIKVTYRKQRGRQSARYLLRCGCCQERLEIYCGGDNLVEIGGVIGTIEEWRKILAPILTAELPAELRSPAGAKPTPGKESK